ncbi:MAG TPA: site-2 protease family protein [Polyangiaceae bacterium]
MNGSGHAVRLGRIFGIEIAFDYSWLFIVFLLTWSLASTFAHLHADWSGVASLGVALAAALLFFLSVVLHELAHSLVARSFGIPVRNITLFLFGGVSNIEREPPSPKAEFLTAIVGPLTSIVLGIVLLAVGSAVVDVPFGTTRGDVLSRLGAGETLLLWLGPINLIVGVFNLIPGFPLDGGRVLRSILWATTHNLHDATRWASAVGQAIGWGFVFLGVAIAFGAYVPFFGRGLVSGLWLAFIGWFLSSAAAQTWRRQLVHEILEGVAVSQLMRPARDVVPDSTELAVFVDRWLLRSDQPAFVVVDDAGRVSGIVTLADVRGVPRDAWPDLHVARIMTPRNRLVVASPAEGVSEALEKLMRADVGQLPVLDGERLVGMLHRTDVARWIELHVQPPRARTYAH